MSGDLSALLVGTALAVGALSFVVYPLFFPIRDRPAHARTPDRAADDGAIAALREIEFDRVTGKLSEADYVALRETYNDRALRELRSRSETDIPSDPLEARVRAYRLTHRECATCGLRPEDDAVYCSTCGAFLNRTCPQCSADIKEAGATFCSSCGAELQTTAGTFG